MSGTHLIRTWSSTQKIIALSSGEAEYYGMVRGGAEAMGTRNILEDMNIERKIRLLEDSSAAKGIAERTGLGKAGHIEVNQLWLQEKVNNGTIEVERVKGETNRADVLTKFKDGEALKQQLEWTNQKLNFGRHPLVPKLSNSDPLQELVDDGIDDDAEEQL